MFIGSARRHLITRAFSASAHQQIPTSNGAAVQTSTLSNNVFVATKGGEQEMVLLSICLAAGSRHEAPDAPGTAHFLKHALFMVASDYAK
jgi:predicted Zn-dependent peptidase